MHQLPVLTHIPKPIWPRHWRPEARANLAVYGLLQQAILSIEAVSSPHLQAPFRGGQKQPLNVSQRRKSEYKNIRYALVHAMFCYFFFGLNPEHAR